MSKLSKTVTPRLCFADTETTGLFGDEPNLDEALRLDRQVIEYAFAIWDDGQIVKTIEQKVMPTGDAVADALFCASKGWNHFNPAEWWAKVGEREYGLAVPWSPADCENVFDFLDGETMAGSNPSFDRVILKAEFHRLGFLDQFPTPKSHRKCDPAGGGWFLFAAGLVEKTGLETLAKHLGVEHKAHTAMGDVRACIGVFERMLDEYIMKPRRLRELLHECTQGPLDDTDRAELAAELAALGPGL